MTGPDMTSDSPDGGDRHVESSRRWPTYLARTAIAVFVVGTTAFWFWALFLTDIEGANWVGDRDWAARTEARCQVAQSQRAELADFSLIDENGSDALRKRAAIIDRSNVIMTDMVDQIAADPPSDDKGKAISQMWITDYRTYLQDRRDYADGLRTTSENLPFTETPTEENIPTSERLSTFATDNQMPSCAAPNDLVQ